MPTQPIRLAVNGAAGRMGARIIALAGASDVFEVVCGLEPAGSEAVGSTIGGAPVRDTLSGDVDVVIDFSLPAGTEAIVPAAQRAKVPLVIGTTGLGAEHQKLIDDAAGEIPVVQATNMSLGVNLLLKLVAAAAEALGDGYDIEIVEHHHRFKKDAPSGTALSLAESICRATGRDYDSALKHGREATDPRNAGEIGMHAVRMGDVVGKHDVYYSTLGETITIGHNAHSRDTFVSGALRAAEWVIQQPAGRYTMADVLFGD